MPSNIVTPMQWWDYNRDDPLARDLVGLWPFWEGMGGEVHDLVGENHGTLTNMNPATDWVPSPYGWALDFDGDSDDFVDCGIIKPAVSTYSQISLAARFITRASPVYGAPRIISIQYSGSDDIRLYWHKALELLRFTLDDGDVSEVSTPLVVDGKWHYAVGTYDGTTIRLYLDGKEVGTPVSDTFNFAGMGGTTNLGRQAAAESYWDGLINDAVIYSRALAPSEIQDLYTNPNALLQPRWRIPALPAVVSFVPYPHPLLSNYTGGMSV